MKKSLILFLVITITLNAQSPVSKNVYSLSGSVSYSSISTNGNYSKDYEDRFNLNPGFDYFVFDNFSIGIAFNYNRSSFEDYWTYSLGAGPAVKYYFNVDNVIPFIGAYYNYSFTRKPAPWRYGPDIETSPYSLHVNEFSLFAGIEYFLGRNVALEPRISYTISKEIEESNNIFPDDFLSQVFSIGIGINVFIY